MTETDLWRDQMEVKDAISDRGRFVFGNESDDQLAVAYISVYEIGGDQE